MRFMVIVKATKDSEAGAMPSEKLLTEMGTFNEARANAGVLLAGEVRSGTVHGEGHGYILQLRQDGQAAV